VDEPDPALRSAAARALARRGDPRAVRVLLRRLQQATDESDWESEDERAALVDALVSIAANARAAADGRAVAAELADAFDGAAEPVRIAIARVLGSVDATEHTSLLALLVQDPSAAVRRAGVGAIARVRGSARRDALRLALADEAASVRCAAATALGGTADPDALADLERLLADEDADVRAATVRAVAELATAIAADLAPVAARLEAALADTAPVALAAVEAFERLAPALSLAPVRGVLEHADPEVVQSAVRCLRAHGRDDDLAALVPVFGHAHWAVRAGAIEAIAARKVRAALPALMRRLDGETDEFVRAALLSALERLEEA
jgi:HEAT repeat protein